MSVEVRDISKTFGSFKALSEVNLTVRNGELLALLGPSGSGKTTLLRLIGGLEVPDPGRGQIYLHGVDVTTLPAGLRKIGFVFQHYALFRHLNVFDNVAFGLKVRPRGERPPRKLLKEKVKQLVKLVQLDGLEGRFPNQLSGGQRQRVALARALAIEPKVLLLDEPFGALDAKVRKDLRKWIRTLHNEIHLTSIFVTHDQDEALEVADRVVVMKNGGIEQVGTPDEVYHTPSNPYVFNFLGRVVTLKVNVSGGKLLLGSRAVRLEKFPEQAQFHGTLFARPHDIDVTESADVPVAVEARVKNVNFAGPLVYLEIECDGQKNATEVEVTSDHCRYIRPKPGQRIFLNIRKFEVFPDTP